MFVDHAPADSAINRATDPDWWINPQVHMLREVHHALEVLQWQNTEDATKREPKNYPERLPMTEAEVLEAKAKQPDLIDALPIDEMREWLGWEKLPA